jgi:hypothetical protein
VTFPKDVRYITNAEGKVFSWLKFDFKTIDRGHITAGYRNTDLQYSFFTQSKLNNMQSRTVTKIVYGKSLTEIDEKFKQETGATIHNWNILCFSIQSHSDGMCASITIWADDKIDRSKFL